MNFDDSLYAPSLGQIGSRKYDPIQLGTQTDLELLGYLDDEAYLSLEWRMFHLNLLKELYGMDKLQNVPSLGKLVDFLDNFRDSDKMHNFFMDDIRESVNYSEIFEHFSRLMDRYEVNKGDNKEVWNFTNNLLRSLKKIKNDEAKFQIPYSEWRVAYEFIDMMKSPTYSVKSPWQVYLDLKQ
ncbi:hypothetical protein J4438_00100 [Candidatus Woesearchaeota archaeon]|nr:hypothetical protein [Candidatus Woesearchaeota archaeon]